MQRKITTNDITEYEHKSAEAVPASDRPVFHLTPPIGWMNDPNGFSWYRGRFHLFYQYHPFDTKWGPVSWGHAVSDDLLTWEQLPPAMAPDREYDSGGCFSGTAIEAGGKQMLMYTGFVPVPDDPRRRGVQSQCIAFGDGLTYEKYAGNPVITAEDLPEGGDPCEFRDPKLLRTEEGGYRAILGSYNRIHGAQLLQYRSEDGLRWSFDRVLLQNRPGGASAQEAGSAAGPDAVSQGAPAADPLGWMWECPDQFRLGGRQILLVSAMDVKAKAAGTNGIHAYHDGKTSLCMIGETAEDGTFRRIAHHPLDQGFDFYAGQTVLSPDGRRILIGWMQDPDTAERRGIEFPINGQMSLPRELGLRGEQVMQRPVRELEARRTEPVICRDLRLEGEGDGIRLIRLEGVKGRVIDLELSIRPSGEELYRRFGLRFAESGGQPEADGQEMYTQLTYEPEQSLLTLDRSRSGPGRTGKTRRQITARDRGGKLDIRLVLDRLSAEVFINEGEQVMSAVIYTDRTAEDISFFIDGVAVVDIAKYRIKEK